MNLFRVITNTVLLFVFISYGSNYTYEGECPNGIPHGGFTILKDDSGPAVVGTMTNGKLDGEIICFASTGDSISKIEYKDGVIHGNVKLWFNPVVLKDHLGYEGEVRLRKKLKATYENGKLIGKKTHWYPSGKKRSEYHFENGELVRSHGWYEEGGRASSPNARIQGELDMSLDHAFYKRLEQLIYDNLPEGIVLYKEQPDTHKIVAGKGWGQLQLDDSIDKVEAIFGKGLEAKSNGRFNYFVYYKSYGLVVYYNNSTHTVHEIYFLNKKGSTTVKASTDKGITWGATKKEIKTAFGKPHKLKGANRATRKGMMRYEGISFRFEEGKLSVIGVWKERDI